MYILSPLFKPPGLIPVKIKLKNDQNHFFITFFISTINTYSMKKLKTDTASTKRNKNIRRKN